MDNSLKTLADLCKLASRFFDEASELISASARIKEILGDKDKVKSNKRNERHEKPEKPEKTSKSDRVNTEPSEKTKIKQDKQESDQNNEKPSKSICQEKPKSSKKSEKIEKTGKIDTEIQKSEKKSESKSEDTDKNRSKRKKTEKHKTGYTLYLEKESKNKRNEDYYSKMNYGEFSKAMMKLWDSLPASEKEIWNENAEQINKNPTVNYVIPSKNYRSEHDENSESN